MQDAIVGLGGILRGDDGPEFGHILLDWDKLIVLDSRQGGTIDVWWSRSDA